MPGLAPGIHAGTSLCCRSDKPQWGGVDGRDKPGYDDEKA
jgi:hypothetical protein